VRPAFLDCRSSARTSTALRRLATAAPAYLERAWDDAKYGRMSEHPYIEAVFPTVFEPGLAPDGRQSPQQPRPWG
jgi:phytoene dehydrogenase-like protein